MPRVPGSFKTKPGRWSPASNKTAEVVRAQVLGMGALACSVYTLGECGVIVAREPLGPDGAYRWRLSISHPTRYPTWDELKTARYLAPELTGVDMAQLLPKLTGEGEGLLKDGWVDCHPHTFHLHEL